MRWRAICERRFERVIGDRTGFVPLDSNTDQPLDGPPGPAVSPIAEQPSSTEEWSLIVALCRPRQGRQKANFCTALGSLRRLLFSLFYRRAAWSVGRPGAAFSTPMSVALRRRFPRRRPPCPCCKFTSSTAISTELAINARWISLHVPPSMVPPKILPNFETSLSDRFRATLVRWYSGHLTSRNFT